MSIYKYISKHFVSLAWFQEDLRPGHAGKQMSFATSGFVMSFDDQWYFATAGHIPSSLNANEKSGNARARSFGYVDHGGVEAKFHGSFPAGYEDAEKFYIYDEIQGLDFALIKIESFYRKTLEANSIAAIDESHWNRTDAFVAAEYVVLGCPMLHQKTRGEIRDGQSNLETHVQIVAMPVEVIDFEDRSKKYERIACKPKDPSVTKIDHVDGFSGGPLVARGSRMATGTSLTVSLACSTVFTKGSD